MLVAETETEANMIFQSTKFHDYSIFHYTALPDEQFKGAHLALRMNGSTVRGVRIQGVLQQIISLCLQRLSHFSIWNFFAS